MKDFHPFYQFCGNGILILLLSLLKKATIKVADIFYFIAEKE